jgi:hypothetical protein
MTPARPHAYAPPRAAEAGGRGAASRSGRQPVLSLALERGPNRPLQLPRSLMRRREGKSAGAHFPSPEQPDPRRLRDGSQTPKIGFGDVHHTLRALIHPQRIFPHGGGATRGVGRRPLYDVKVVTRGANSASKGTPRQTLGLHRGWSRHSP